MNDAYHPTLLPAESNMAVDGAGGETLAGAHAVQFYESDGFLVDMLSYFVQTGLDAGEACIVIATRPHRARLAAQLHARGVDLISLRRNGQYTALDANKLLTTFMVGGMPDPDRFTQSIGQVINRATRGGQHLRLFGEMVAQLWLTGNKAAALRLETLWNELHLRSHPPFTLLCAYPAHVFAGDMRQDAFAAVSRQHAHVLPDETYPALASADERLRTIALLQQKAHSLQIEVAQRERTEERLRLSEHRYRSLFESSLDGILMLETDTGRISEANPAAAELLGLASEALLGQELWQVGLLPDREAACDIVRTVQEQSVIRYDALPLRRADGEQRDVEFVGSLIRVNGTDGHDIIQCTLRDVTSRTHLEREVAQRTRELEAIQTVTDATLAHVSLDTMLPELLERIRAVLAIDNVAILLPDRTGHDLRIYLARGPEEVVAGQVRVPIGQGVAGRIAASRQPLVIDDLATSKAVNPFLRERLRSLMGVPLLVEDRLIGVIHAATIEAHHFTPSEVRLLQLVADRIALAIERAQLHQRAQQARREAVERASQLYAIIESMSDGVVVISHEGRLLQMNATAQRMLGLHAAADDATAMRAFSQLVVRDTQGHLLAMEDRPASRALRGDVITGAQAMDLVVQGAQGRDIQVSVSAAPVRSETGAVLGAVCVFRDVSEQRRLEQRTREALSALLAMAGALVDPPIAPADAVLDATKSHASVAPQPATSSAAASVAQRLAALAREVLGCQRVSITAIEPATLVQVPIAVVGLSADQERQWWEEQRAHPSRYGEGADPELRARFEAGETLVLDMGQPPYDVLPNPYDVSTVLVAPLRVGSQLIGSMALDFGGPPHRFAENERALAGAVAQLVALVIERDRLLRDREEARVAELAAQEATRQMQTFLGIAGHELRTPVTSIKASVQLSERALNALVEMALPAETMRSLQRAQLLLARADQQTDRLHRLIEDLLDVTRIRAGKLSLHIEMGDLGAVVRRAVEAQRTAWARRDITLVLPPTQVYLRMDADRIEQVVANFLTNALKYSADDQPVVVEVTTTPQKARVAVRDHGPGLSREMQAHLWEPFHQVEGVQQQSGSGVGLGLGLHICRTLIERHGGQVGVESVVGQGSTFWFELPMTVSPSQDTDRSDLSDADITG